MNIHSCPEPRKLKGSCCRALSTFLRGHRQWNHMSYRWQVTPLHKQATPQYLIMWYFKEPGTGLFAWSWSHAVICREACWTLSCCRRVNSRLCEWEVLDLIDRRDLWSKECNVKLGRIFLFYQYCIWRSLCCYWVDAFLSLSDGKFNIFGWQN